MSVAQCVPASAPPAFTHSRRSANSSFVTGLPVVKNSTTSKFLSVSLLIRPHWLRSTGCLVAPRNFSLYTSSAVLPFLSFLSGSSVNR